MKKRSFFYSLLVVVLGFLWYVFWGQEYQYASGFASKLYNYPLPPETKIINKDFDYGVFYAGGPSGSGGYPTVAAFIEIESELSEKELYNYYDKEDVFARPGKNPKKEIAFEFYLDGYQKKQEKDGKVWYSSNVTPTLGHKSNQGKPIKAIVQIRAEFSYPFFIDFN